MVPGYCWKVVTEPRGHPKEFRADVLAVPRRGEAPIAQAARDFGVFVSCLSNWLQAADIEDGNRTGDTASETVELRESSKRVCPLEHSSEVRATRSGPGYSSARGGKGSSPRVTEVASDEGAAAVTFRFSSSQGSRSAGGWHRLSPLWNCAGHTSRTRLAGLGIRLASGSCQGSARQRLVLRRVLVLSE